MTPEMRLVRHYAGGMCRMLPKEDVEQVVALAAFEYRAEPLNVRVNRAVCALHKLARDLGYHQVTVAPGRTWVHEHQRRYWLRAIALRVKLREGALRSKRTCSRCSRRLSSFQVNGRKPDGSPRKRSQCRDCTAAYQASYYLRRKAKRA